MHCSFINSTTITEDTLYVKQRSHDDAKSQHHYITIDQHHMGQIPKQILSDDFLVICGRAGASNSK